MRAIQHQFFAGHNEHRYSSAVTAGIKDLPCFKHIRIEFSRWPEEKRLLIGSNIVTKRGDGSRESREVEKCFRIASPPAKSTGSADSRKRDFSDKRPVEI